jgi:hypothetical protein
MLQQQRQFHHRQASQTYLFLQQKVAWLSLEELSCHSDLHPLLAQLMLRVSSPQSSAVGSRPSALICWSNSPAQRRRSPWPRGASAQDGLVPSQWCRAGLAADP